MHPTQRWVSAHPSGVSIKALSPIVVLSRDPPVQSCIPRTDILLENHNQCRCSLIPGLARLPGHGVPASTSILITINAGDAEWIRIRGSAREIRMQLVPAIAACCSKASLAIIRAVLIPAAPPTTTRSASMAGPCRSSRCGSGRRPSGFQRSFTAGGYRPCWTRVGK